MKNFDITFKWVGASTWVLTIDNYKIACDPILGDAGTEIDLTYFKTKRRTKPHFTTADFKAIDVWLLTHNHADHIDSLGMAKISPQSTVLAHKNLKPWFVNRSHKQVYFMNWRDKVTVPTKSF